MKHENCRSFVRGIKLSKCLCCGEQIMIGYDCISICTECSEKHSTCTICGKDIKEVEQCIKN